MNTINFKLRDGLPMNQDVLDRLQSAFSIFNAFGNILGDKTIVSGCELVGSTISDGVVYLNGQVYPFKGGLQQTKVILNAPTSNLTFKDNNSYPVINTPYISFGTGVGAMDWADFKAGFPTKNIDTLVARITALEARPLVGNIPIDLIALWGRPANEIPPLWVEYTGLAGRLPMGFKDSDTAFDVVGKIGGAKGHTLTIAEMPKHKHTGHVAKGTSTWRGGGDNSGDNATSVPGSTDEVGGSQEFSILNPYRVVHYIQYKGV